MVIMDTLVSSIDKCNASLGKAVAYLTFLMAFIMFTIVVLRYGFAIGSIALQESLIYLHAAVFLLGSAFTYQQNAHVRVDVFYRNFSAQQQTMVNLIGCLIFMLPMSIFITIVCWHYVMESWLLLETSREPGGLPFVYILKSFLLVFSFTMVLQAFAEIAKHSLVIFANKNKAP